MLPIGLLLCISVKVFLSCLLKETRHGNRHIRVCEPLCVMFVKAYEYICLSALFFSQLIFESSGQILPNLING